MDQPHDSSQRPLLRVGCAHCTLPASFIPYLLEHHKVILSSGAFVDLLFIPGVEMERKRQKPHSELVFLNNLLLLSNIYLEISSQLATFPHVHTNIRSTFIYWIMTRHEVPV